MNEQQVCEVRRRRSRQEVEQLVAEYESSGLSQNEFCRERGLALSTLGRYRTRRKRQAPAGSNAYEFYLSVLQLDPSNKVWNVENLYVADASFFPSSAGANPALTVAANALRVAESIANQLASA